MFVQGQVVVDLSDSLKRDVEFNAKNFSKMTYIEVLPALNERELVNYNSAFVSASNISL